MTIIKTPTGRFLGRRPDAPDPRDHRFHQTHPKIVELPPRVDLRSRLPPVFDQGEAGTCGPCSGDALMCFLFPKMASIGFSRLQIYYDVRVREGTIGEDAGVQTRNVLRVMYQTGAAPESDWPYDLAKLYDRPARPTYTDAARYRLRGYSRLVSEISYLQSLAQGSPFLLGIELFESFDGDQLARTGVVTQPGSNESTLGGHDVLVVGYDLHFKDSDAFKNSGVDPALVSDRALLIRNSWGPSWSPSLQGHFYLPFDYATNPSTGGDAWVGIL